MKPFLVPLLSFVIALAPCLAQQPGPSGYHLTASWKIGGEGGWDYLTVDPAAHRLYIARANRIQVVDTEKGTLAGEVPGLDGAHGVALAPEFGRGFASSGRNSTVVVFDLKTLATIGTPIATGKKPDAIIYDPSSKRVFAFNGQSDSATVIDAATGAVAGTVALGGGPEFAAADGLGHVYVNLEDKSEALAINAKSLAVEQRWPLAPGEAPTGLAVDAAKRRLFAGCHNEKMIVLDADKGAVLATLPIGKGVDATAFDPGTGFAFSSNGDGTLTVVAGDAAGIRVLENVATKRGARTMALDPQTHAVYLATAEFEPASPGAKGRPKALPGSFVILKYEK